MALALRLRRALAAASTSASLFRPAAAATASPSRSLLLAPFVPSLPPPFLPGAAAGFRSTAAAARGDYGGGADQNKIDPDEILFEGCDYNHWLITMEFPDPKPSREEMIETYLQTLAKVVGSYEEAKKRMYALSTTTYIGFQAVMTEEMSEKFRGLPGVVFILPDSYLYPETKEYGGDKYENGVITPRPPPVHYSKPSRTDRNRTYRGDYNNGPPPQGNYQNNPRPQGNYQNSHRPQENYQNSLPPQGNYQNSLPPQDNYQNGPQPQGNYQNSLPPQGNYQNNPPQQGNFQTYNPQQDGRGNAPQQNYTQAGEYGRAYGRNDFADRSGQNRLPSGNQEIVNEAYPGQGYRNFSQGQVGDSRPGGPMAPGTYGQPSAAGTNGQPPKPTYPGHGGDNWQGDSGQYHSPGEGQQGNWGRA